MKTGKNVNIERGAYFGNGLKIEIGDNSGIGINAHIYNNTIIGQNVMMGPEVYMLEKTHNFDSVDIPMIKQGSRKERDQVIIGDDCWIGREVLIIGSRVINKGSIIGARCVLTKSFPEYSIIGGNPSKLIRSRVVSNN
ncbi:acyltransferase [Macellibacteroides fermentans]|nr:acyltransferase [Parabacteroides chartae]